MLRRALNFVRARPSRPGRVNVVGMAFIVAGCSWLLPARRQRATCFTPSHWLGGRTRIRRTLHVAAFGRTSCDDPHDTTCVRREAIVASSLQTTGSAFQAGVALLENEGAYAVMAAASALEKATGRDVVHLEIGQPGFPTPQYICDAAKAAIDAGDTKYCPPAGTGALRERIAAWTAARTGISTVAAEHVVVGPGAKPGLFFTTLALVRGAHDEVIIPDPGFPTYRAMVHVAGGTLVPVRLDADMRSFDMAALEAAVGPRTRMLVLNSPSNPCGGVVPDGDLARIADLARKYDFYVLSDEIYSQLVYSGRYTSILSLPDMQCRTIVVDGFSKSWSMTGWRLGWAVMPAALAQRVELLMVHSVGCTAAFTQAAGLAALDGDGTTTTTTTRRRTDMPVSSLMREAYRARRDLVVRELNGMAGVTCRAPEGAFYAWADVSSFGLPSREVAQRLLRDGFVAVLPGTDFGEGGEGYIRISYVSEESDLKRGMDRIRSVLEKL